MSSSPPPPAPKPDRSHDGTGRPAMHAVNDAVSQLRFGSILLTIHDGRIVQLDVTERQRFT